MHYVIKGTSRCGKTMLTNMIVQNLVGYNKFSLDKFISAFHESIPQIEINHDGGKGMKELFPNFIKTLFNLVKNKDGKIGLYYVLEGVDISEELLEEFNKEDDVTIICLAKASLTKEEYFKQIRFYEKEYQYSSWTKTLSDQELYKWCEYWVNEAKYIKKLSKEKGYLFFDTSHNQDQVLKDIVEKIKHSNAKNLTCK